MTYGQQFHVSIFLKKRLDKCNNLTRTVNKIQTFDDITKTDFILLYQFQRKYPQWLLNGKATTNKINTRTNFVHFYF